AAGRRGRLGRAPAGGVGGAAGGSLPLAPEAAEGWRSERWTFRRGPLFLRPGDSPIGLRLPLASLGPAPALDIDEPPIIPPDPRRQAREAVRGPRPAPPAGRTALCVESRDGRTGGFLPPLPRFARFRAPRAAVA